MLSLAFAGAAIADTLRIVALGDSLTAGFRLPPSAAFPVKLEKALRARGHAVQVANAGVSGDTTKGGLQRLEWAVPAGTDLVIVELGANDALRGLPPEATKTNLDAIISQLKAKGATVLLAGMKSPRNWGDDYVARFEAIYPSLAQKHAVPLYPFFLEGIATRPDLNLDDGLHPNEQGVDKIVEGILPAVEQAIAGAKSRRGG